MLDAKKLTSVIESAKDNLSEQSSNHSWNGYKLTVSGSMEDIEKAYKVIENTRNQLKKLIDSITVSFPSGKVGGDMSFTLEIRPTMEPSLLNSIKNVFDSSLK